MCKLIVLDDDKIQHLIFRKMLNQYHIVDHTMFSDDGNRVLDFLENYKSNNEMLPELIFLDLNMPNLNGWKFLEQLKNLYPQLTKHVTVYIISSSVNPSDVKRSKKYSFVNSYIIKPITRERLNNIVEHVH
ncbi:response regulator [Mucilaginibacter phyllosphaerae]